MEKKSKVNTSSAVMVGLTGACGAVHLLLSGE